LLNQGSFEGRQGGGKLIGATGLAGPRTRAFDAREDGYHFVKRLSHDEFVNALDVT